MLNDAVYLALGANLGERAETMEHAVELIGKMPTARLIARSRWLESAPEGGADQPPYLNGVIRIACAIPPSTLLDLTQAIERQLGRKRKDDGSPRLIDIDLLLYGEQIVESTRLTLPHPRLTRRFFVLKPLVEIAPDLIIPGTGLSATEWLRDVQGSARDN
jgi:2-amino-4-hydroxy-6-hydroxymethyldihydropteridine diphosphokinase